MATAELRNLESQLDLLSYAEQLSIMEYIVRLMKKHQLQKSIEENTAFIILLTNCFRR